jgi:hypothetical protein
LPLHPGDREFRFRQCPSAEPRAKGGGASATDHGSARVSSCAAVSAPICWRSQSRSSRTTSGPCAWTTMYSRSARLSRSPAWSHTRMA